MRKSVWLLSAGLIALSFPAQASAAQQEVDVPDSPETDTDDAATEPTQGATAEAAAVDDDTVQPEVEDAGDVIIVTATRRNQALSDVPLAVSAVTAEQLENTGATDIRQLQQVSPSLLVTSTQSEAGAATARIRGIGTVGDNPGLESSVGVFIDGVYRSRTGAGLTELGPLDRVEVLRGPQGTLFGRNTSAGLLSIITAKPLFAPMYAGQIDIGSYDTRRLELSATGPLTDSLAARLDGVYMKRDGFVEDLISGRDVNGRDRWLMRGQLLYEPDEALSVRIIGDYSARDEECCAAPYLPASDAVAPPGGGDAERVPSSFVPLMEALGGIVPDDPFAREVVISPGRSYRQDVDDWGVSGEVVYDFAGGPELTSITAYRVNDLVRGTDIDFSNLDIAYRPDDGTAFNKFKTFSQELRLQGEAMAGRLDWLVGGYLANEKLRSRDSLKWGDDFDQFSSCLAANTFVELTGQPALISPSNPTCFNPLVATGVQSALVSAFNNAVAGGQFEALPGLAQQITALGAFAGLDNSALPTLIPFPVPVDFSGAPFTGSGFENLGILTLGNPALRLADMGLTDDFRQTSNNFAVFTHNIFAVTDRVDLTLGLRYTHEKKELDANFVDNNLICSALTGGSLQQLPCVLPSGPGGTGEFNLDGKRTENELSGTVVLSFKPTDNILTYASYARGYKAGGFNLDRSALSRQLANNSFGLETAGAVCPTEGPLPAGCVTHASAEQLEFAAEINDAFELGLKYNGSWFDVNVAAFHQLFTDFQLNTFNGVNFIVENINSCEDDLGGADSDNDPDTGACTGDTRPGVRSRGVEFELFSRPLRDVNFNVGVTYADTEYRDNLVGADGRALTNALFQLPGRRISNSSLWTVTSALGWSPPIGDSGLRGLFYIDMRHQSQMNTGSDLDIEKIENGYTIFNGRIGIRGPGDDWGIELWAQNLFDENVKQIAFDALIQGSCTERGAEQGFCAPPLPANRSNQLYGVFLGEPRTYGLTLRGRF